MCIHHWYLDDKNRGRCTKCSEAKDFGALQTKETISYQFIAGRELTISGIRGYRNRIKPIATQWSKADMPLFPSLSGGRK